MHTAVTDVHAGGNYEIPTMSLTSIYQQVSAGYTLFHEQI